MIINKKLLFSISLFVILFGLKQIVYSSNYFSLSPINEFKNYSFNDEIDLINRVKETPDFVLNILKKLDNKDDYKNYNLSDDDYKIIEEYIELLPDLFKKIMSKRLIGIYFIENFLGGGYTEYVLDENSNIYTILIFNPDVLKKSLTEFLSYKENSLFVQNDSSIKIVVNAGEVFKGFLYILIHETAHIIDYVNNLTPFVEPAITKFTKFDIINKPFTDNIWQKYNLPEDKYNFIERDKLNFYGFGGGPKILISDANNYYEKLIKTPFASLYGTKNWAEDFAEYCAFYWLHKELQQPYEIQLFENDILVKSYKPFENITKRFDFVKNKSKRDLETK